MSDDIIEAHKHAGRHRAEVMASQLCGCFYCLAIFHPSEIDEWVDGNQTALCPHCGIDAILGDQAGYELNKNFLRKMHQYWF